MNTSQSISPLEDPLRLEPAAMEDIEVLVQIIAAAFAEDEARYGHGPPGYLEVEWHHEMLTQEIYLKMLVGTQLVGGIIVKEKGDGDYFLNTLFLHPDYHNRG